jgi:hypothetical protein
MSRDQFVIVWRDQEDSPSWSTYTNEVGTARAFTTDDPEMAEANISDMIVSKSKTHKLLPANAHTLGSGHVAVAKDLAVEWLGWPVE